MVEVKSTRFRRYLAAIQHSREASVLSSHGYRNKAAACLLASQQEGRFYYRKLHLSMAASWLSLARRDEATAALVAVWDTAKPVKTGGARVSVALAKPSFQGTGCYRPVSERETRAA